MERMDVVSLNDPCSSNITPGLQPVAVCLNPILLHGMILGKRRCGEAAADVIVTHKGWQRVRVCNTLVI